MVAAYLPDGATCTDSFACGESSHCNNGICCKNPYTCCTSDAQCTPSGKVCGTEYHCILTNGTSCWYGEECASGNCNFECCEAGHLCCRFNSDCPSGQACYGQYHYCMSAPEEPPSLKTNGSSCSSSSECESGNCQNGICCSSGYTCCTSAGNCGSDQTCGNNYHCETTSSSGAENTSDKLPNGEGCLEDSRCQSGYCVDWLCRATPTVCGDGICDHSEKFEENACIQDCVKCQQDSDCPPCVNCVNTNFRCGSSLTDISTECSECLSDTDCKQGYTCSWPDYACMVSSEENTTDADSDDSAPEQEPEQQTTVDLKSTQQVLGYDVPGMTNENAARYDTDNSWSKYFGLNLTNYAGNAQSWEEVANYELRKGKRHLTNGTNVGYFKTAANGIQKLYKVASFLNALNQLPDQINALTNIKNLDELKQNAQLVIEFTDNMVSVSSTIVENTIASREMKITPEDKSLFSALKENGTWALEVAGSGGFSLLADASNALFSENATQSIAYEIEAGNICLLKARHAQEAKQIAEKSAPTEQELQEYFFHVKSYLALSKAEIALRYRDDVAVWRNKTDLAVRFYSFIGGSSDIEATLAQKKADADAMIKLIEKMEKNVEELEK
ncbi:MAG: hypothetical protein V1777_03855 [Candidatus Micrarchaeota archaeon]